MERAEDIFLRLEILESASKECAMVSGLAHSNFFVSLLNW
jgi:hypothetical protein